MNIRFTRSILHKGAHHERGSIADLPDREALLFIRSGDALALGESPARETAAAAPAAETAALPKPAAKKTTGKSAE